VDEGSAVIEVRHPRFQVAQRQVTVGAGTTVEVAITLEPVSAPSITTHTPASTDALPRSSLPDRRPPRAPLDRPRPPQRTIVTTTSPLLPTGAAVGGLGLAASVGLYLGATVVAGEFDRACFANGVAVTGEVCGARFQRDQETIDALQWGAVGSLGLVAVGSTLAIIGALSPSRRVVVAATTRQLVIGGSM
jgi:hypothetical protein